MVISSSSKLVTSGEPDAGALPPVGLPAEELARAALKAGAKVGTIVAAAAPTRLACRNARRFECENIFGSLEVEFLEAGPADFRIRVDGLDEAGRMRDEIRVEYINPAGNVCVRRPQPASETPIRPATGLDSTVAQGRTC